MEVFAAVSLHVCLFGDTNSKCNFETLHIMEWNSKFFYGIGSLSALMLLPPPATCHELDHV